MKVKRANAGALTNFEVLDFLRSRHATSDPMGCLGAVAPSECKVFDYLVQTAACNQTREIIDVFLTKCAKFNLVNAEKLNIMNLRPTSPVEIYPILEACENRMADGELQEMVDIVANVLPPPPQPKSE